MIISVGRQTGAGGRELVVKLAKKLGFEYLDQDRLLKKADEFGYFEQAYRFYNETPVNSLLQAISGNEMADEQSTKFIKEIYQKLLENGNYIIMGRCANCFLRGKKDFFSVFLHAPSEFKQKRLIASGISSGKVAEYMSESDNGRARFHRYYTGEEWGGSAFYDLCINTGVCGVDNAVELIEFFISHRL